MSPVFLGFVCVLVIAQIALPKRYAFVPLIVGGLHIGNIEILPELTTARLLIAIGLVRAILTGSINFSLRSKVDLVALALAFFAILSSVGHSPDEWTPSPLRARVGWVFNVFGAYLFCRSYLPDLASLQRYALILPLAILPLGIALTYEKALHRNLYYPLGGVTSGVLIREGKARAAGPFKHPILAGTVGATTLPFALFLWRERRRGLALVGVVGSVMTVVASSSSGPMAALILSVGLYFFWNKRHLTRKVAWGIVLICTVYTVVSGRGPWYLMLKVDVLGGGTAWHRAFLIDQAWSHLSEWWLWGTSRTRHWMPSGVSWNPNHVDFTNYYLHIGVMGGLPTMLTFFYLIYATSRKLFVTMTAFRLDGRTSDEFLLWTYASSLACHAISCLSISYFDQMYIFIFILLGVGGTLGAMPLTQPAGTRDALPTKAAENQWQS